MFDADFAYVFIDGSVPCARPTRGYSTLFAPDSVHGKLAALTAAALEPNAVEYQLQLSVLLKGPKGSGKFTATSWVARHLGIHLFEVRLPLAGSIVYSQYNR